jgi:hypothetical protein
MNRTVLASGDLDELAFNGDRNAVRFALAACGGFSDESSIEPPIERETADVLVG